MVPAPQGTELEGNTFLTGRGNRVEVFSSRRDPDTTAGTVGQVSSVCPHWGGRERRWSEGVAQVRPGYCPPLGGLN